MVEVLLKQAITLRNFLIANLVKKVGTNLTFPRGQNSGPGCNENGILESALFRKGGAMFLEANHIAKCLEGFSEAHFVREDSSGFEQALSQKPLNALGPDEERLFQELPEGAS